MCIIITGNKRPQLKDINDYVVIKCAANWEQLGKNLNINECLLSNIKKDCPRCEDCCSQMLNDWLDSTPNASWGMLLNAIDKVQSTLTNAVENLAENQNKKLADKLPDTVEKLDIAADKLPDAIEKLDTVADKLPDTVEKLNTATDKFLGIVEKLADRPQVDQQRNLVEKTMRSSENVAGNV